MNNFHDQGRACYKRGDYKRAIEFFDRAIGHAASVQTLDNRAACYEKLGDLQAALKDAKRTIQLHREDATGYLRAGKILVKMEKDSVALEIYTHGLKRIKHVGQGYELLRKVHRDLMDKTCPPKSVDPLTVLPRELAEIILEYLSFRQRVNACLVSKQWATFVRSCPNLWRHLDLTHARRKVRNAFVSRAINSGRQKLKKATLNYLYDSDKVIAALVKHCPLEDLTLMKSGLLGYNLAQVLTPAKHLKRLILDPHNRFHVTEVQRLLEPLSERLEHLELSIDGDASPVCYMRDFPRLHTLSVTYSNQSCGTFHGISERLPALRSLRLHNELDNADPYIGYIGLAALPLTHLDMKLPLPGARVLGLPSSLIVLKLTSTNRSSGPWWFTPGPAGLELDTYYLPHLQELELDIPRMIVHNASHVLVGKHEPESPANEGESLSKLRKLCLSSCNLNYLQISELFKHPRLKALELVHLPRLQSCCDGDVDGIMDCLPNLQSLDLSETDITGVAVRRAVEPGHLNELILNNCRNIGLDAIEWARERGVRVRHNMSEGLNGGRKVRHI